MPNQQPPVDQKRLNEYTSQFKNPAQTLLSSINQTIPNIVDQLIHQCITLENELEKVRKEKDNLILEKTTAKSLKEPNSKISEMINKQRKNEIK